jgi:hypothetical protein
MTIWGWLLLGAGSWALAIVLKVLADFLVQRNTTFELKDWAAALLSGVWSSVCELGLCAIAFWYWQAGFADGLVAAVGAALAEFIMLLPAALQAHFNKAKTKKQDQANWRAFFLERSLFITNHIATRALLWFGVMGVAGFAAAASAFGFFAVTEGTQAYGQAREWNWLDQRTQTIFFGFVISVLVAEVALIIHWW